MWREHGRSGIENPLCFKLTFTALSFRMRKTLFRGSDIQKGDDLHVVSVSRYSNPNPIEPGSVSVARENPTEQEGGRNRPKRYQAARGEASLRTPV